MAVVLVSFGNIKRWVGLSTDARPTPGARDAAGTVILAADVPSGSTFFATDNFATDTFDGAAWHQSTAPVAVVDPAVMEDIRLSNRLILRELRLLRRGEIAATTAAEYDGAPDELDEPT